MRLFSAVLLLLLIFPNLSYAQVDLVKVDKSKRRMYLLQGNEIIREYRIALGNRLKGISSKKAINAHQRDTIF